MNLHKVAARHIQVQEVYKNYNIQCEILFRGQHSFPEGRQ